MDVKTAFLYGELEDEIYMKQPEGFVVPGQEHKVCKLQRSLYGLKQAPLQWHLKFDSVMLSNGFRINECDKCVYIKNSNNGYVIVCLYVDDMLIMGSNFRVIQETKGMLSKNFSMKDMGLADVILGIKILRRPDGITITQSHYVEKVLKKFNAFDKPIAKTPWEPSVHLSVHKGEPVDAIEYAKIIGSLLYLTNCTRPDIACSVNKLGSFTANPSNEHWKSLERVLRYLKYTQNYAIHYTREPSVLEGYCDANWISDAKDSFSTSGYVFTVGGGAVSWKSKKQTCRFFSCFRAPEDPKTVSSNHDDEEMNLFQDVQNVIQEMDDIKSLAMQTNTEKVEHHDKRRSFVSAPSSTGKNSSGTAEWSEGLVNGILGKLVADQRERQVIPITGMGGIGKTTLAKTVYSKPIIEQRFDIRAWATISQQYNTREILCELVSQATKQSKEQLSERSEDELGLDLHKHLSGRRFLIVMDDIWSIDAWDRIQRFFPDNEECSRILVTTRLSQLSSQLNNNYIQMKFLDEVLSWKLFSKIVFGAGRCPRELEEIGKKIVENCKGLPLSIVVVGGILKNKKHTLGSWESIRKNLASVVNLENDKHCLKVLKMSYNHLPVYLKPCFLYMGVFEEDDSVKVSTLVKLWVSEGFLKPENGKSLETIAIEILKDLVDRNLILVSEEGSTGNIKLVKIHDLLRDLCLNEGKRDGFYHVIGQSSPRGRSSQRRIVIPRNTPDEKILDDLQSMPRARSVISEYREVQGSMNSELLRTLHACKSPYIDPFLVSQCVNLRHLAVRIGSMSSIFSSFSRLWNLHTLIVSCTEQSTAPAEIWRMPQLRHIKMTERSFCLPEPSSDDVVVMESLLVLERVRNFKCSEEVVKRIPNIKKLGMQYFGSEGIEHDDYYCLSNIKRLCKLESLYISCWPDFRASLYVLTFPQSLKKLTLSMNGGFEWEKMLGKIGALPLLEKFKLWMGCFKTGKWEMVEGQFPCLKYLGLYSCPSLEYWTAEASSIFPRLEKLQLFDMEALKEIPFEIGELPNLQKIWMRDCGESSVRCAKEIVEEQVESQGEDLPFHVEVWFSSKNEAMQSLAGPNFEVSCVLRENYNLYKRYLSLMLSES
ncbi:putative late blight resistance protein homolog R1A-10 [Salvia miltiorrhiza]|uniref:putative late blight resistance protein homolog R1A-10 n=1 Tax=Salvia miltiorrhiza TaxID=226208 RepID=UPI0025ACE42C|nr:putative late blight resistance protein homolog R1A-10 [Salvia miltiorrhiza]